MGANGRVQHWGTICCHCCRRRRHPFYPKSVVGSHFTFISDSQTVHCLSCLSSAPRLLASCAFWRWVDTPPPPMPPSPSSYPHPALFGITVSVVEVARPLRGPGAGPPLEVRLCWPRLGRPLRVAPAVGRWVWRQTLRIPPIPRTQESQGHSPSLPLKQRSARIGSGRVSSGATEQNVTNLTLIPIWFLCN